MTDAFLLSRALLRFDAGSGREPRRDLSAAALGPDGSLWLGSDEGNRIDCLRQVEPLIFGGHETYVVNDFLPLPTEDEEIDIEGMDYADGYLWLIGSHSTKRKKPKGKDLEKDLGKLATLKSELNRYLLGRIPLHDGVPVQECPGPEDAGTLTAASFQTSDTGNQLVDLLKEDEHLGRFVDQIPSKENGVDIEGLAVRGSHLFVGLRGPVLRGWAVILELKMEESEPGRLTFAAMGKDEVRYRKHFVDLNGLGVRELCLYGKDLLILAGPTMDLESSLQLFRLHKGAKRSGDTITGQDDGALEYLFSLPFTPGADHAEGLALCPCLGRGDQLLTVYDTPAGTRIPGKNTVFADIFRLDLK